MHGQPQKNPSHTADDHPSQQLETPMSLQKRRHRISAFLALAFFLFAPVATTADEPAGPPKEVAVGEDPPEAAPAPAHDEAGSTTDDATPEADSVKAPAEAPPADGAIQDGHFDDEGNWIAAEHSLSGDEIYRKVLDNRFNSYEQKLVMESGDRGGNTSDVEMDVKYLSMRDKSKKVLSNSIAKYHAPMDVRHMGYLVINKAKGVDDQFVYLPSNRRVRRVNLRGESVVGTDFSLEDIIPREFEDATYKRLPNATAQDIDCYVVEVTPNEESDSDYSRFVAYIDRETFVPIQSHYWDRKGVKIKELSVQPDSITRFEDVDKSGPRIVWVALHSRVENLKLDTYTNLDIEKTKANPGLGKRDFSQRELTSGR